jgi:hypothetical protein
VVIYQRLDLVPMAESLPGHDDILGVNVTDGWYNTSRPKHRLFDQRTSGWYSIDLARGRPGNLAGIPVSPSGRLYRALGWRAAGRRTKTYAGGHSL